MLNVSDPCLMFMAHAHAYRRNAHVAPGTRLGDRVAVDTCQLTLKV